MEGFVNEAPNPDLSKLNDRQEMALTQLSYMSDKIAGLEVGITLREARAYLVNKISADELKKLDYAIDAGLGSFKIKAVGNNKGTGFGAIAFEDTYGNMGVSYRGTDVTHADDWIDNVITYATGKSPQSDDAIEFFKTVSDAFPDKKFYVYGHSKGGELAEYVFVNFMDRIEKVNLFNPQPLNPWTLTAEQLAAMQSDKLNIIVVEGDPVHILGLFVSWNNVKYVDFDGNPISAHLFSEEYFNADGSIKEGQRPDGPLVIIGAAFMAGLQVMTYFTYRCALEVINYVSRELWSAADRFIDTVTSKLSEMYTQFKEFSIKLKDFLIDVKNTVAEIFAKAINPGYVYAKANTYINVDTAKLHRYAERLRSINRRISALDRQMDSLYRQVGFLDLLDLIRADILTGHSWRIDRCINYLTNTAADFEAVERAIASKL